MGMDSDAIGAVENTVLYRRTYRLQGVSPDAGQLRHILADNVAEHPRHMRDFDLRWGALGDRIPPTAEVTIRADHDDQVTLVSLEWTDADAQAFDAQLVAETARREDAAAAAEAAAEAASVLAEGGEGGCDYVNAGRLDDGPCFLPGGHAGSHKFTSA